MADSASDLPDTDDRDPVSLVPNAVDEVLALAQTWLAWNGVGRYGDENVWTPYKALRRVTDHLLDHLAEIDALLVGAPTIPDTWHGRTLTLDADGLGSPRPTSTSRVAGFVAMPSCTDYDWLLCPRRKLDRDRSPAWTIRQIVHHVSNVTYYAHQLGDLRRG